MSLDAATVQAVLGLAVGLIMLSFMAPLEPAFLIIFGPLWARKFQTMRLPIVDGNQSDAAQE